jgi:hypothetical protein
LLSCFVVAACATAGRFAASAPTAQRSAGAAAPAVQRSESPVELPWSVSRPLTWDDFRGAPPRDDGAEQARTVYQLSYESRCRGIDFTFSATAVMLPAQSWVRPRVLTSPPESARVLGHEQTHFNLTETYVRRMRKFFRELYNPCGLIDEKLRESVDRFGREEAEAQKRYDEETGYGLKPQVQDRWDREIAAKLTELAAFAK